jgi:hypothetical protein
LFDPETEQNDPMGRGTGSFVRPQAAESTLEEQAAQATQETNLERLKEKIT